MISDDTLSSLYERRKKSWFQVHAQMQEFRDYINGDTDVDLPELDRRERSAIARLGLQGLNQLAMRVASITAEVTFPPLRPGIDKWEDKARQSREVTTFWTQRNALGRRMRRRARHLIGYSMSPVFIRPRFGRDWDIPEWDVRDPLMCLPNPHGDADDMTPPDCVFAQRRSLAWLKERYPDRSRLLRTRREPSPDDQFEVVEFVDDAEWVLMAKGVADDPYSNTEGADYVRLDRIELRTDRCPVVIASRITLDRLQGHFDDTIGIHQYKAKLFALAYIAARKGVLPETWLEGEGGSKILVEADAEAGVVGHVTNGRLRELKPEPGYLTMPILSALEREMRIEGGTPAEFSGECVDEETEIFTAQGWKRYDQVQVGDEVLTLNHDTTMAEWQPVLRVNVFAPQPKLLLEVEGLRHSSLTTLNHRWPVQSLWKHVRKWVTSEQMTSTYRVPIAAMNADVPTEPKWTDALVELVGWYWTEGTRDQSRVMIAQSAKKPENVERIRAALRSLFGEATHGWRQLSGCGQGGVGHDGVPRWNESLHRNGVVRFNLSAHAMRLLEEHAPDKTPSFAFLRSLTQAQLELFLRVSLLADNCGPTELGQKDRARSEAFGFAAILAGNAVSYHTRTKMESRPGWRSGEYTSHQVNVRKRRWVNMKENGLRGSGVFRHVLHEGLVWCPTTSNGTWYARRRGTVYFTGNSATNVRTGRRGDAIMSATVDFPVQEYQELLADSLREELRIAIGIDKSYHDKDKQYFFGRTRATYKPSDVLVVEEPDVSYAHAGTDANGLVISGGQRVGLGAMSLQTFREIDPLIGDAEREKDRVLEEALDRAAFAALEQQANAGTLTLPDLARIKELIRSDRKEWDEAVMQVQREAQERQATTVEPVPAGAPEAQAGIAPPGQGAEGGIVQPQEDVGRLTQLLGSLRMGQRTVPQEVAAEQGAA